MRYFASKDSIGLNQVHPYSINVTTSDMLKERKGDFKRAAEKFYLCEKERKRKRDHERAKRRKRRERQRYRVLTNKTQRKIKRSEMRK